VTPKNTLETVRSADVFHIATHGPPPPIVNDSLGKYGILVEGHTERELVRKLIDILRSKRDRTKNAIALNLVEFWEKLDEDDKSPME
jgi:hypothetical protein